MKKRAPWIIAVLVAIAGYAFWVHGQEWLNPRPVTLSMDVDNNPGVPVVRRVEMNGFGFADLRSTDVGDTGGLPYKSRWNNDLEFSLSWIELYNKQAWQAHFTIPVEKLAAIDADRRHVRIKIKIGAGGDLRVATNHSEFLRLIRLQRSNEITDDMRVDVVLEELCAQRLADDDPIRKHLLRGLDKWAVGSMKKRRDFWILENPLPTSRCSSDWRLKDE